MLISFTKRKVHYIYGGLALVSLLLLGISSARAQETSAPMMDHGSMNMGAPMRSSGLSATERDRFINLTRNVTSKMEAVINRLENIASRLEARITVLKGQGINTDAALASLVTAKSELAKARGELSSAGTRAEAGLQSDSPRERFVSARAEFMNVRESIRNGYLALRASLAETRDAVMEAELNGRTTSGQPALAQ